MKGVYIFCILLLVNMPIYGQHLPQYSMFSVNPYEFNAASAGMTYSLQANAGYRSQWNGLVGAPTSYFFNLNTPLYNINGAVGFQAYSREIGLETRSGLGGSYSYVFNAIGGVIALGARGQLSNLGFDGSRAITSEGSYEGSLIDHRDPAIPDNNVNDWSFSSDIGIWYQTGNMQIGLSANNIYHSDFSLNSLGSVSPEPVYTVFASYEFDINQELLINTSLLFKSDGIIVQSNFNSYLSIRNSFIGGFSFIGYDGRSVEELGLTGGFQINEFFTLFYTYGIGLNQLSRNQRGTHEVLLQFDLGKPIDGVIRPSVNYNTRFLE